MVTVRNVGKTEVLNLTYEPETWYGSDTELKTDSENGVGEDLSTEDCSEFVLALGEDRFPIAELKNRCN